MIEIIIYNSTDMRGDRGQPRTVKSREYRIRELGGGCSCVESGVGAAGTEG